MSAQKQLNFYSHSQPGPAVICLPMTAEKIDQLVRERQWDRHLLEQRSYYLVCSPLSGKIPE